ncbi:heterochromatin protein 1 [Drosophila mojavensis]|uniref:Heterochromatin protein 1E n=1 Tax=Drosophila mojavensis TaxID=7230 RepID=B4K4Y1_DROMO|nr:heterochromatin protein 1 [Drosophila mojavensis]EDW13952.1 heterochromatin protein 1E [Drosophila mojavensis]
MEFGIWTPTSLSDIEEEDMEYIVEKILDRRIHLGELEYFVKWQNFPDEDNTWELSKFLDCHSLIAQFESQRAKKNLKRQAEIKINEIYVDKAKKLKIEPSLIMDNAFDYGHIAEKILYAINSNGKISLLIQFKDLDQPELIASDMAYSHIPMMVIKFYEEHLKLLHAFSTI